MIADIVYSNKASIRLGIDRMEILSMDSLLQLKLFIPKYQRPYKWQQRNMHDLLDDISKAIEDGKNFSNFKYRIGTIILYKENDKLNIVDGQQRIITLLLIRLYLDPSFRCSLLDLGFPNKETQRNIHNNYKLIKDWFRLKNDNFKYDMLRAFCDILEVVVLSVDVLNEAFQLFDSQNSRGKALDPHDLLKAYHLRAMRENPYEMKHVVKQWEDIKANEIRELFVRYLFPIFKWNNREKTHTFSANDIDIYKGISENSSYTYAKRIKKAMPYFQLSEAFIEGEDFFLMVFHYLNLLADIKSEIEHEGKFHQLYEMLEDKNNKSTGFKYATDLFYCALLCYYDKFHNFDEQAIKKLFTWAFMIRVDMENLGMDTINKYAIGEPNNLYSNSGVPVFSIITRARKHNEISNMQLRVFRENKRQIHEKWNSLHTFICNLNGELKEQ